MAGSILIPLKAVFDDKGVKDATTKFRNLGKTLTGVLGAVGIGTSFAALTAALKESSKAAVVDVKSQALLANQLKNTVGATDSAIAATEEFINALELQTSIADDELRPALSTLVRATGDVSSAQKLLSLSTDIAAGTGKDLGAVSIAVAKAAAGQTTQLFRLIPSLKGSADWASAAAIQFDGMAAAAANNDPYQQMEIIFGRIQEQVGMALLPSLQTFSAWLASPETQSALKFMIDGFNGWVAAMKNTVDGANAVGMALANVLNINPNVAGRAWNGFFNSLGRSIESIVGGPFGRLLFTFLRLLGGGTEDVSSTFKPVEFTPTDFSGVGYTGPTTGGKTTPKKTKAQVAAEKAAKAYEKALADLKKFQTDIKGMADFTSLTKMSEELGQFEQSVTDSFDEIYNKLADAPKGTDLTKLKAFLDAEKALLLQNAKDRDAIVKKRQDVEALLTDIKSSISGMGKLANLLDTSTRTITKTISKIVNGFKVATTTTIEEALGAKGYQKRLEDILLATKNFATQLTQLKAAGLTADLFLEIAQAGPEVGGQLAAEILAGGADAISALNTTYGDLQAVSSAIAEQTAAVLYNNGVEVAGGLVKGLLAEEQKLVDAGKTLADQFNTGYTEQLAGLTVPGGPTITPKTQPKATVIKPTINIKATPNTKADAQRIVAAVNKYATASGYGLLNAKML